MKKYLSFSVLAIATALTGAVVLTSCSHDDATFSEENAQQAKHAQALAQYQKSFIGIFGQPESDQCWDFTLADSKITRASSSDSKSLADWPQESYNVYGYTWKYEVGNTDFNESIINSIYHNGWKDLVAEIKAATPKTWAPSGTYKFRLAGADVKKNPGGKYYTIGADFGSKNNYILRQIKTNGNTSGVTGDQHTSAINFDIVQQSTPTWFTVATDKKQSSVKSTEKAFTQFVEIQKTYNNKTYTFWCFKVENSYADIVLIVDKINAATNYYAKRYFVEDLGGVGSSDIDFNDMVFDVIQETDGTQKCIVRALGGTINVKITVCGKSWTQPATIENMNNTGADGNAIDLGMVIDEFTVTNWDPTSNDQISVEVQDKEGFKFITEFPKNGEVPLIVAFSIAKPWKAERKPITKAWMSEEGEPAVDD